MRRRTLPLELLLLAFLAVFLIYPLIYVIPGAASEEEFEVRLLHFGEKQQDRKEVRRILKAANPDEPPIVSIKINHLVRSFPTEKSANDLTDQLIQAGAQAAVVHKRNWTGYYFRESLGFRIQGSSSFPFVSFVPNNPFLWECMRNSLVLALVTTLATTLLCLPLARWFTRYRFMGRTWLASLLLVPLILPPFVGAIGVQRLLGRFGTINVWLMDLGVVAPGSPIRWLGEGGLAGVVIMQVLHLYPILYLNLAAAWSNVDPTLEDAARNLGASEFHLFRTVTFPLLLPGYFAGATLVFVWAFTDLGTPLVFGVDAVIPVQIFNQVSDPRKTNSMAYALVVVTLVVTGLLFFAARWAVSRQAYVGGGKGAIASAAPVAGRRRTAVIHVAVLGLTLLAVLPTVGVILTAFSERWSIGRFTALPESYTTHYVGEVWSNRIAAISIRNSLLYSSCSTMLDIVLGVTIAWLVARRPSWLTSLLDGLAMLPLALPGLVLAFGYLTCFNQWNLGPWLDPTRNPVPLLIVAYTIRRMPFLTRSSLAGLQQIAPVMEEAAENLGASRWRVLRTVTVPLIAANVIAGAVLTFAFAMLEVSDSLMLAREEKFYPITKAIVGLLMRPDDGDQIACALSVFAMGLLGFSLLTASVILGRKMGELFRA